MKFILSGFLLLFYLIGYGQTGTSPAKNKGGQKNTVPRTVVIYSSDNSFFEDYPIDSLVEHLNLLNENPYKKLKLAQWYARGDVSEKAAIIIKLVYYLQGIAD